MAEVKTEEELIERLHKNDSIYHVVRFYKPDCPVCTLTRPAFIALSKKYPTVDFCEIDVSNVLFSKKILTVRMVPMVCIMNRFAGCVKVQLGSNISVIEQYIQEHSEKYY